MDVVKDPELKAVADPITLEEFIIEAKPNSGLVASFKVENADNLASRTKGEWEEGFSNQSKKVYK